MRPALISRIKESLGTQTWMDRFMIHPVVEPIVDLYYDIRARIEWTKRSYDYAKFGWQAWDFDALTIEHYMLFKLKRVQKCLINGHCDLTVDMGPKKMKALKLMIKLLERLNGHYHRFLDMHDVKWGEGKMVFTKVPGSESSPGGPYSTMDMLREKANTSEEKEQERKEFLDAVRADDREEARDRKLVYRLLEKYICYLWD